MLFNTIILTTLAVLAASVQANCAAGKVLGKFAICGSNPVDCGSGLCCQQGATCVPDATAGFRCSMPLANIDSSKSTKDTVLLNAGCYDVVDKKSTTSTSTSSSKSAPKTSATSPSSPDSSSSGKTQASSQNSPSSSSPSKLSSGALAGIIIGSIIAGLLLLAVIATLVLLARRRKNNAPRAAAGSSRQEMGERSNSSHSSLQKPAPVIIGEHSRTTRPTRNSR